MRITYIDIGLHKEAKEIGMIRQLVQELAIQHEKEIQLTVYGYEAHPAYAQRLGVLFAKQELRENESIHIRNAAICAHDGSVELYLSPSSGGEGNSIYISKNNVRQDKSITVRAVRLSREMEAMDLGDFVILRFNIEGAELEMMQELIISGMHKKVDLFCGAQSDILKVQELSHRHQEYQQMLADAGIRFRYFHAHYLRAWEDQMMKEMRNELERALS